MKAMGRILLYTMVIGSSGIAAESEPTFTGSTIADSGLKKDALRTMAMIVHGKLKCDSMDSVDTQSLPIGAQPTVWLPPGAGPATYERWVVTACSKKQPFIVVFWPAKEGGMMFRIQPEQADS